MRICSWLLIVGCLSSIGCQDTSPSDTRTPNSGDDDDDVQVITDATTGTTSSFTGFRALIDGIVFVAPSCDEAQDEVCNARDDNCDGVIDEGCGVQGPTGVQIVLRHFDNVDAALSVQSPAVGHQLNRSNDDPEYNGVFYLPKEEPCVFAGPEDYVQAAHWPDPGTPNGTYRVDFTVNTGCDAIDGDVEIEAVIGLSVAGEFIGSFRFPHPVGEFASAPTVPILEFDVD